MTFVISVVILSFLAANADQILSRVEDISSHSNARDINVRKEKALFPSILAESIEELSGTKQVNNKQVSPSPAGHDKLRKLFEAQIKSALGIPSPPPSAAPSAPLPTPLPSIFVLGDLHGDLINTAKVLSGSGLVHFPEPSDISRLDAAVAWARSSVWTGGDSILVQLGDINDRGPEELAIYALFSHLRGLASRAGGKIYNLFGNHEGMTLSKVQFQTTREALNFNYNRSYGQGLAMWFDNQPLGQWMRDEFEVAVHLRNQFVFVHAGLYDKYAAMSPAELKKEFLRSLKEDNFLEGQNVNSNNIIYHDNSPTWVRVLALGPEQVVCPKLRESLKLQLPTAKDPIMFVGHTVTSTGVVEGRCPVASSQGMGATTDQTSSTASAAAAAGTGRQFPQPTPAWPQVMQLVKMDTGISSWMANSISMARINAVRYANGIDKYEMFEILVDESAQPRLELLMKFDVSSH